MNPASYNFHTYRENTFAFAFILQDGEGDPLDMSLLTDLSMRVFLNGRESRPVIEPDLSITGNHVTGVLSSDDTERLAAMSTYYELNAMMGERFVTLVNGRIIPSRASTGGTQKGADLNVAVNIETLEVSLSVADSAALAMKALAEIEAMADQVHEDRDRAETAAELFAGQISVLEEGDDYISLYAMQPAELTESKEPLGDTEISIINITYHESN